MMNNKKQNPSPEKMEPITRMKEPENARSKNRWR
jgi:hypothetical protein